MNSFDSRSSLSSGNRSYTMYRLPALEARGFDLSRLPFSLKILLENLLRREDGVNVTASDRITFTVGGSTITLTPSGITLQSAKIDLNP